jgi:hypothetical protein
MKRFLTISALSVGLLLTAVSAKGSTFDPTMVTMTANPSALVSNPGSTVGWGYTINNGTDDFISVAAFNTGSFQMGTIEDIFDYPQSLGPGSVTEGYDPLLPLGLAQFTWATDATPGFTNIGNFTITFDAFDPAGDFLQEFDVLAPFSISTTPSSSAPEPTTFIFLTLGFFAFLLLGHKLKIA